MQKNRLDNLLALLEKEPDDSFLLYAIAFEYESQGENELALQYYNSLLSRHPEYIAAYYQTGLLHSRVKAFAEATDLLNKGLEIALRQRDNKAIREFREAINMVEDEMDD